MSHEEKEQILNTFKNLPSAVKTAFAAGKAFGDMAAQTDPIPTEPTDDQPEA